MGAHGSGHVSIEENDEACAGVQGKVRREGQVTRAAGARDVRDARGMPGIPGIPVFQPGSTIMPG